ncbi:MAG: DUF2948 family protein [Pseudomonadota bacterium]
MAKPDTLLKLAALDAEDLVVLSAHAQDATVRPADIIYDAAKGRLLVPMNRFAWETPGARRKLFPSYERRNAVLHLDWIKGLSSTGIDQKDTDAVLPLLGIESDAGLITLQFGGGAVMRAEAEAIEARLTDLGGAWRTRSRPRHAV